MKWPRFTLRFLLVAVTLAAVALGIGSRLFLQRPVAERRCESVKQGMSAWQVRWQLGAPHNISIGGVDNWLYSVEGTSPTMLSLGVEDGCVIWIEHKDYRPADWFEN